MSFAETCMAALPSRSSMLRAFLASDPAAEGRFIVGVTSTGIFCRPTCTARKPRPENVVFFADTAAAQEAGFRPCRRCHPLETSVGAPPLVLRLQQAIEDDPAQRLGEKDLLALGIDPSTARRQFKRYHGVTFQAYARAQRLGLAWREVKDGARVTDAQFARGFESASGFRTAFHRIFGVPPREADRRHALFADRIATPLGTMLGLASDAGLVVLDFADRRGLERKLTTLRTRLRGPVIPGSHPHLKAAAEQLAAYFAGRRFQFDLPLAPVGSAFELAAWRYLQTIPYGETRSYARMASDLGRPGAARAAGRANGMNFIALVIPCHRVIGADGALTGYGGGLARKHWLIQHERDHAPAAAHP